MIASLNNTMNNFANQYEAGSPTEVFCRLQIEIIANQLDVILKTTARRIR